METTLPETSKNCEISSKKTADVMVRMMDCLSAASLAEEMADVMVRLMDSHLGDMMAAETDPEMGGMNMKVRMLGC
jgi:hypothetical protein